jgi:hypothetical protein
MLSHGHRDRWELLNLPACRLPHRDTLTHREHMPTPTPIRPILNDLINRAARQQTTTPTLVTRLSTLRLPNRTLHTLPSGTRRIAARRQRRITRALRYLTLKTLNPTRQQLNLAIHPQQHPNNSLTTPIKNSLSL